MSAGVQRQQVTLLYGHPVHSTTLVPGQRSVCARNPVPSSGNRITIKITVNKDKEGEMENIVASPLNTANETGTLVQVNFQKSPYRTQKYLEAEPKALGVTQIMLSLFFLSAMGVNWNYYYRFHRSGSVAISTVFSLITIIAGSVAIAAQNLHLPKLKACLGMQVVACVLSVICLIISISLMAEHPYYHFCWDHYHNSTSHENMCSRLWFIYQHVGGLQLLVQVTQVALSATLAAFCCKIIQCCTPRDNVPVIVVNAPPGPQ